MTRLQTEWQRLYLPQPPDPHQPHPGQPDALVGTDGQVRAAVLGLAAPTDWAACARVWQGVQADLGWPAPAIAVAGDQGYQLWFSLARPVPAAQARAVLDALQARYLADLRPGRVRLLPAAEPGPTGAALHAAPVPAPLAEAGTWSAFVSQDLAPLFAETPWLDTPPGDDAQAGLLARLASITPGDWQQALATLQVEMPAAEADPAAATAPPPASPAPTGPPPLAAAETNPRRFLLAVMNDGSVPLALRIEAAKALLPLYTDPPPQTP